MSITRMPTPGRASASPMRSSATATRRSRIISTRWPSIRTTKSPKTAKHGWAGHRPGALASRLPQRLQNALDHFLGIAEKHHCVRLEEELVLDPRIARTHAAFDEEHGLGFLDVEDRHAVDRRFRIGLGGGIGH